MNTPPCSTRYRRYDSSVKDAIAHSQNPYLFPELKIPRTTALYWIKTVRARPFERPQGEKPGSLDDPEQHLVKSPKVILWEAEGQKVFDTFKQVYALFGFSLSLKHLRDRSKKKEVIQLVEKLSEQISLKRCLEELQIAPKIVVIGS
jgi:hypothetical protein